MLSAFIPSGRSYPAMPLAGQLVHRWSVHSGPLVLGAASLMYLAPAMDMDRTVSPLSFHRITKPYFRTCSTRQSRSQAPFCLYALRAISVRAEGTFGRLRCSFGGDRPSQTARLVLSRMLLTFRLDPSHMKAGIPTVTPINLAIYPPSLPAILYVICQRPMPSCSKAPWGLSVQSRVTCIFTGISISPGPSLRQCPNRYAFRAGRNLPDKEFRYLRTVIVTAAASVRCFISRTNNSP